MFNTEYTENRICDVRYRIYAESGEFNVYDDYSFKFDAQDRQLKNLVDTFAECLTAHSVSINAISRLDLFLMSTQDTSQPPELLTNAQYDNYCDFSEYELREMVKNSQNYKVVRCRVLDPMPLERDYSIYSREKTNLCGIFVFGAT